MSGTSRPSDPHEPISFDALTEKFQELERTPKSVEAIAIEDEMKRLRNKLVERIGAQKSRIHESQELFEEISKSIRRVQGVQKTDIDDAVADRNIEIIAENLSRFREHMDKVFDRWKVLQRTTGSFGHEPAPAHTPEPAHHESSGHGDHKKEKHGKSKSEEPAPKLPDHHWKERDEGEEKPILDFPALELQKSIKSSVFSEVYKLIAEGNEERAMVVIMNLFSENGNFSDRDFFISFVDAHIPQTAEIRGSSQKQARFIKLWTEKLWKTVFHTIKQAVTEDIAQSVEKSLKLDEPMNKTGMINRTAISGSRRAKQIVASAIAMGVPATTAWFAAGALVSAVGAPAFLTGAAAGLGAVAGRRAITGWWDWATEEYKNLGKEGEEKRSKEKKKKEKTEILDNISQSEISLRMASWISQALRDTTATEAATKDKTAVSAEKTGLRPDDDANLYLLRMNAARKLHTELSSAGPSAETAIEIRTATLDQLVNGLNAGRLAAPAKHEEAKKAYEKKAGLKPAQYVHALGEFGAEAEKPDEDEKKIGNLKFFAVGATIGTGIGAGALSGGLIPAGIAVAGLGYAGYERATREDFEHIKIQFKENEKERAEEAKSLIDSILSSLKEGDTIKYEKVIDESSDEIWLKVRRLEAMLASGAFAKKKSLELLVRNAIHDGRRGFGLEHLEAELNGSDSAGDKKTVERETKRLTKKKFNWSKVRKPLVGLAIIASVNVGSISRTVREWLSPNDQKDPTEKITPPQQEPEAEGRGKSGGARPVVENNEPQKSPEELKKENYVKKLTELRNKVVGLISPGTVTYLGDGENKYKEILEKIDGALAGIMDENVLSHLQSEDDLFEKWLWPDILKDPELALVFAASDGGTIQASGHALLFFSNGEAVYLYNTAQIFEKSASGPLVVSDLDAAGNVVTKFVVKEIQYENGILQLIPGPAVQ